MKDAEIRRRPVEKRALVDHSVRAFCLSGGNLRADEMAARHIRAIPVSYTHLRAHETVLDLVCRLLLEKKKTKHNLSLIHIGLATHQMTI